MKNTILLPMLTATFLVGIAVCTFFIVQNRSTLHREVKTRHVQFLNQLATRLVGERVAEFYVSKVVPAGDEKPAFCELKWRERLGTDGDGSERFGPERIIGIAGVRPRFEALIVEFDDTKAPESLALGSGSLILFRRAYGEHTAPNAGYSFADFNCPVPLVYAVDAEPSRQERETWRQFWRLATDPVSAEKKGLRVRSVAYSVATTLKADCRYRVVAEVGGRLRISQIKR